MTRILTATSLCAVLSALARADTTATTIPLPGGTSAVGAYTLASVYGQSTSLDAMNASSVILSPGYLCIEADDVGNPGDLNNDGIVNGVDLAIILSTWGLCGSGACIADINQDGLVNGIDLAVVLSNWG
jgi:hypothetical protein